MRKQRKSIGFSVLSGIITKEYERKGYSRKRAGRIGHATAGKIARRKGR